MTDTAPPTAKPSKARAERREIPGNFPYTTAPGVFSKVLERIPVSERPPQFTQDFLGSVLQATGGSARPIIPILKKAGLLRADGVPTEAYAQFQSDGSRGRAALEALKTGWPEIFRRNQYAHKLDAKQTEDLFRQVTGLPPSDGVLRAIVATYNAFRRYVDESSELRPQSTAEPAIARTTEEAAQPASQVPLALSTQINVVLPETTDISVYHAIFRSIRENLL